MNKERKRVPKGEKYWRIKFDEYFGDIISVEARTEYGYKCNDADFNSFNYFYTERKAKRMAKKIRAVIKGATVIEMPDEEEIKRLYPVFVDNDEDAEFHEGMRVGISNTIDCFKDKIVK